METNDEGKTYLFSDEISLLKQKSETLVEIFSSDNVDGLKCLLNDGLVINHKTENGFSLLHFAVIANKKKLLCFMLSLPNIKLDVEFKRQTPLILSFILEDFEWVTLKLIEAGCNVNITNEDLQTPLHKAASAENISLKVCHALIQKGIDVNAKDVDGLTALHLAVYYDELVHMLLYYEADATIKCYDGFTPFMKSVRYYKSAGTLIEYVIDINETSYRKEKFNALLLSLRNKSPIAFEIIKRGGDLNYISPLGHYALLLSGKYEEKQLFDIIWSKMDKNIILESSLCLLDNMIYKWNLFSNEDWIECFYQVFNCDIISDIVDQYVCSTKFIHLIQELSIRRVEKEDRLKMIYLFLSYSVPVEVSDVHCTYEYFGYNEEVDALLSTSQIQESNYLNEYYCFPDIFLMPTFLINYDMDLNDMILKFIQNYNLKSDIDIFFNELINIFKYCTPTKEIRDAFHKKCDNNSELDLHRRSKWGWNNEESKDLHKTIVRIFDNVPLPSIFELARNSTRKLIINKYKVANSYDYVKALEALTLPMKTKKALLFKLPLHKC